jgi:hypothetical protein
VASILEAKAHFCLLCEHTCSKKDPCQFVSVCKIQTEEQAGKLVSKQEDGRGRDTDLRKSGLKGASVPHRKRGVARRQWLTPVILATQETEIRRIEVRNQPQANNS